ncbi:hypothetical protein HDV05_001061 [Chytridiales sp. JEL 0842]|nr:hypothetical protein HDV05_001061 [Chytridiales sp. JEL 0842]
MTPIRPPSDTNTSRRLHPILHTFNLLTGSILYILGLHSLLTLLSVSIIASTNPTLFTSALGSCNPLLIKPFSNCLLYLNLELFQTAFSILDRIIHRKDSEEPATTTTDPRRVWGIVCHLSDFLVLNVALSVIWSVYIAFLEEWLKRSPKSVFKLKQHANLFGVVVPSVLSCLVGGSLVVPNSVWKKFYGLVAFVYFLGLVWGLKVGRQYVAKVWMKRVDTSPIKLERVPITRGDNSDLEYERVADPTWKKTSLVSPKFGVSEQPGLYRFSPSPPPMPLSLRSPSTSPSRIIGTGITRPRPPEFSSEEENEIKDDMDDDEDGSARTRFGLQSMFTQSANASPLFSKSSYIGRPIKTERLNPFLITEKMRNENRQARKSLGGDSMLKGLSLFDDEQKEDGEDQSSNSWIPKNSLFSGSSRKGSNKVDKSKSFEEMASVGKKNSGGLKGLEYEPQRFFAPVAATGLEDIFEQSFKLDTGEHRPHGSSFSLNRILDILQRKRREAPYIPETVSILASSMELLQNHLSFRTTTFDLLVRIMFIGVESFRRDGKCSPKAFCGDN